jgi:hypothetical protein
MQEIGFGNWNVVRRVREERSQTFGNEVSFASERIESEYADFDRMVD